MPATRPTGYDMPPSTRPRGYDTAHSTRPRGYDMPHSTRPSGYDVPHSTSPPAGTTQTSHPRAARGERTGGDLLSQAREGQVPSALWGLTSLFGKGRGVSPTQ